MKNAVFWHIDRVTLVITDVSKDRIAYIVKVTRIGELGTTLAVTSNRSTLRRNTMKNGVLWDVTPCGSCKNRRSVRRLLVAVSVVPSSPIHVTIMKEALGSSET
jgi:hypothetical protein